MKRLPLSIKDFSGGLNNRDPASAISPSEASVLENYFTDGKGALEKRLGQDLVQYAPIDPQPFATDADTLALWHLDEISPGPWLDSSANARNLDPFYTPVVSSTTPATVPALFPIGAPLGIQLAQADTSLTAPSIGQALSVGVASLLDDLLAVTFDIWIKIPSTFSGKTISGPADALHGGAWSFTNSNSPLVATWKQPFPFALGAVADPIMNGLSIVRTWAPDQVIASIGADKFAPRVVFKLKTKGIPGTTTSIVTNGLPFDRMLHIRGRYNSATSTMNLEVNGTLHRTAVVNGGGLIDDAGSDTVSLGGIAAFGNNSGTYGNYWQFKTFSGVLDECRISSVDRGASSANLPYKTPRGMGFEFAKSDGTRQCIVNADTGLYYTVGNAEWTKITDGLSPTAFWDAFQQKDILYLANSVNQPLAWDGLALKDWGNPSVQPSGGPNAGTGVTAGVRRFAYTYLYGLNETGPSPYFLTDANGGGFQYDIGNVLPRHANATGVRFYSTKAGADDDSLYYLYREIVHDPVNPMGTTGPYVAGSAPSYLNDGGAFGVADALLGTTAYPQMSATVRNSALRNGQFLLGEHQRGWVCGIPDSRYLLAYTELGAPDVMRSFSTVSAAGNKGALIALASFYGEIQASKDGSATLILRGDSPANWNQLETLHPDVGAIDHWSYVRRYLPDTDKYILCFAGRDQLYEYAGQSIRSISDKMRFTLDNLAQNNSTRLEWSQTTQNDFLQASTPAGAGGATKNIRQSRYETDGIREEPGKVKIVDQLDYLALQNQAAPLVTGNIIAICKGPAEGEFFFSVDTAGDRNLYRTTDNFVTLDLPAGNRVLDQVNLTPVLVTADHKIIEITYASIGGKDKYWVFTSDANESGYVCLYNYTDNIWETATALAGPYFWQADTNWKYAASNPAGSQGNYIMGRLINTNGPVNFNNSQWGSNVYLNHAQKVTATTFTNGAFLSGYNSSSINGNLSNSNTWGGLPVGTAAGAYQLANHGVGFVAFSGSSLFTINFTVRETALWKGGTFRPQSIWDSTNGKLWFVGSGAEDANGNRTCSIYSLTTAAVVAVAYTPAANSNIPIASDGLNIWFVEQNPDGAYGFIPKLKSLAQATSAVTSIGEFTLNQLPLRLSWNVVASRLVGIGRKWVYRVSDDYNYSGVILSLDTISGASVVLKETAINGNAGAVPVEIVYQPANASDAAAPTNQYVVVRAPGAGEAAIYVVNPTPSVTLPSGVASAYVQDLYFGDGASAAVTGILSNLIYVPSSDIAGNYLWADRLYWFANAASATDARLLQHGVPGSWEVRGTYVGQRHALGLIDAFDTFDAAFAGQIDWKLWNSANPASLWDGTLPPATGSAINPNQKIAGTAFNPPTSYVQWAANMVWIYTAAAPTVSPELSFVTIGYFLGVSNVPRVVGAHYRNRTFWTFAEAGQADNNIVVCYQKDNTWTTIRGWRMKSMFMFRNMLMGLQDVELVKLFSGYTDLGKLIVGRAMTGYIMGDRDKMIAGAQINLLSYANPASPNQNGYVMITPYKAGVAQSAAAWVFPIPPDTTPNVRRVKAVPFAGGFPYAWCRAFAIEIKTSEELTGDYVPVLEQPEIIQAIDLMIDETGPSYDLPVN